MKSETLTEVIIMTKLFLMRHGETYFNKWHRIQGWCDSALTPTGVKQTNEIKQYFIKNNIYFDKRYTSTSERACDTMDIICENSPYMRLKSLKECNFGKYEGSSERLNPPYPYGDFFKKYGGESEKEVQTRMNSTILSILLSSDDSDNILIISHAGAILNFLISVNLNPQVVKDQGFGNCSVLEFEFNDEKLKLKQIINPS